MGTFDYFDRKPSKPQSISITTSYYDPVEIVELEDEEYEIMELDD